MHTIIAGGRDFSREEQVVPALRALQKYLKDRDIYYAYLAGINFVRDFWR